MSEMYLFIGIFAMICGCLYDMHCQGLLIVKAEVVEEHEEYIVVEHPPVRVPPVVPITVKPCNPFALMKWTAEDIAEWRENARRCDEIHQATWSRKTAI